LEWYQRKSNTTVDESPKCVRNFIVLIDLNLLIGLVSARSIRAAINLYSYLPSGRGGSFDIVAETNSAILLADVQSAPIDSSLNMVAFTYFADAEVRLPPSYEGQLALWNSGKGVDLDCDGSEAVVDPAAEGRRRDLQYGMGNHLLYGSLSWVPQHDAPGAGSVYVETSMGTTRVVCSESKPQEIGKIVRSIG
jgi:hypothetical protein